MASRRYFLHDPYEYDPLAYYYTAAAAAPYNYRYNVDAYYQLRQSTAPARRSAKPAAPRARDTTKTTSFEIPVTGPDSDPEPEPKPKPKAMSAEEAALRMQAAVRGFLSRKSVRAVRQVQREAEQVHAKMATEADALVADPSACVAVGEALMKLLLRLDGVRGARVYRRRITKRLLALQDAVDELVTDTTPASSVGEENESEVDDAPDAADVEMAGESAVATELPDSAEPGGEMESIMETVVHTLTPPAQMEIDETIVAAGEAEAEAPAGEEEEKEIDETTAAGEAEAEAEEEEEEEEEAGEEALPGDAANVDVDDEQEDSDDVEGEWEMVVTEEEENEHTAAPVTDTSGDQEEPPCKDEPACPLETSKTGSAAADSDDDGVDVRKLMQMMAAMCEQSTKQCAVMGALAERVDALERAMRRMEDAESRRP